MMINQVLLRRELSQQIRNNETQYHRILRNPFTALSSSQSTLLNTNTTSNTTTTFYKPYSTILTHNTSSPTSITEQQQQQPKYKYFSKSSKNFSTESSDNLAHLIARELEDEESSGNNVLPTEAAKLKKIIEKDWSIVDKPSIGYATLYKKDNPNGMKIAIQFHCQDTENPDSAENPLDGDDEGDEENDQGAEESGSLRFMVSCNKAGKNMVIGCITGGGQAEVETVVVRDGDTVDEGFILRGTEHLYQGPEFYDLASDLQESFNVFLQEDCGVDETVSSFLVMYTDFKEQTEYEHWLKTIHGVVNN